MGDEIKVLEKFLTTERLQRIDAVLRNRTRNLVLVLEDIYDPHNAAACLRSAEAMGVQEVHVVTQTYGFKPSPKVTNRADKWLDIIKHETVSGCVKHLKDRGFTVAATSFTEQSDPIHGLDFTRPVAMVFGNEHEGVSAEMLKAADRLFFIPMLGFAQSFNISVASAIALYFAVGRRTSTFGQSGDLSPDEKDELRDLWVKRSVPMADAILDRVRESQFESTEEVPADEFESTEAEAEYPEE